ncbi:alanine-glyoxylate transaminase/serine-glyoxylate transaminase/serine-pyruvate transaminase [Dongia mobilis]|uniref:Alanine-glyoxylate transaminase/serine-glyoxylate transaminase/serine-pyruvate transaminase n=1 Tax=Dongia mobilis TaxID=578943 RepID=A0A4R6WP04_9PROT|nr:aminotransferase class V-fold PLP-dependent enzyme [Dongia mobilis]TDQ80821.1 alanine-glyoxylate transaminase/serine-glyoxylate transaminase/serine-pyruvate transaminase [Dongia mobilis]
MAYQPGRQFLQIPGPTNIPDRVLRAIAQPVLDHRGPEFAKLAAELLVRIRPIFKTRQPVLIFPASGTGAWESALVNTLSPGDRVLGFDSGQFALLWTQMARKMGFEVETLATDWRRAPDPAAIEAALSADREKTIKAVLLVHNETANGCMSRVAEIRAAMDRAHHPALLLVDTISSLGSADFRMDEWGVDVAIGGSQKGLMLPAGLAFCGVSEKAIAASKQAKSPRCFWDWEPLLANTGGNFPYTPACNLFFGLREALDLIDAEGLENIFTRHARHAEATRRAIRGWGLEIVCAEPRDYSQSITAAFMPDGHSADSFRKLVLERFNMPLGAGLGRLADKAFRIGHLGDTNDLMLGGTLFGVEMGLVAANVPHNAGGVMAALSYLAERSGEAGRIAA